MLWLALWTAGCLLVATCLSLAFLDGPAAGLGRGGLWMEQASRLTLECPGAMEGGCVGGALWARSQGGSDG